MPDTRPLHAADEPADASQPSQPQPQPSAASIDADALAQKLQEGLKTGLRDALEGYAQDHNVQPRQSVVQPPVQSQPADPVRDFLNPYLEPRLQNVERAVVLRTEAAMDAATFYNDADPKRAKLKSKFRGDIEQLFSQQLQQGQYIPRENLFRYVIGVKFDDLVNEELQEREQARERARQAQGVPSGSPRPIQQGPAKKPWEMSPEELQQMLEGVEF